MPKRIATCRNVAESIMEFGYEDFFPSRTDFLSHLGNIEVNANMLADANRLSILSQRPDSVITGRKGHYSDISENPFKISFLSKEFKNNKSI